MTDEKNAAKYAELVKEVERRTEEGQKISRFGALGVLEELGIKLNKDSVELVEKLYADGFITE